MIRRALFVDTETTGLDPSRDTLTEVGAILYSVTNASSIVELSWLTGRCADEVIVQALTGITPALAGEVLEVFGDDQAEARDLFLTLASRADCVLAHNAAFDRQWLGGLTGDLPWLCTLEDFRFPGVPANATTLANLALTLGVPVTSAHRALTDCRLLASIFTRLHERRVDLQELFEVAQRPKGTFVALVSYQDREIAKRHGFRWDSIVSRSWARRMPVEETRGLPFAVREVRQ